MLVCTGDFTNTGELEEIEDFIDWFAAFPHRHKLLIAGNHDVTLHPEYYEQHWQRYHSMRGEPYDCAQAIAAVRGAAAKGITYLEDEEVTVEGVRVFGSPWQPEFCNWAFNRSMGSTANLDRVGEGWLLSLFWSCPAASGMLLECPRGCLACRRRSRRRQIG